MSLTFVVIRCGISPTIANAVYTPRDGVYGDVVVYTCMSGFWFTRLVYNSTSSCVLKDQYSGEWTSISNACTRM